MSDLIERLRRLLAEFRSGKDQELRAALAAQRAEKRCIEGVIARGIRAAAAEAADDDALRQRMSDILRRTADALHGGPLEDGFWSWHDLPAIAERLRRELAEALSRQSCDNGKPWVCHALATARGELAEARWLLNHAVTRETIAEWTQRRDAFLTADQPTAMHDCGKPLKLGQHGECVWCGYMPDRNYPDDSTPDKSSVGG